MSIACGPDLQNQTLRSKLLDEQGKTIEAEAMRKTMLAGATNAQLNAYPYTLLNQGKNADAVKICAANAKDHPDDPNVLDSLGEGYMINAQKGAAVKSFKKSLGMHPPEGMRANSIKCLKQMGVDTSPYEKTKG